jgi:hypothetical protein
LRLGRVLRDDLSTAMDAFSLKRKEKCLDHMNDPDAVSILRVRKRGKIDRAEGMS